MTDSLSALNTELTAALAIIDPQVEGLDILSRGPFSQQLVQIFNNQLITRSRRQRLIAAALTALDALTVALAALDADGYPTLLPAMIAQPIFEQIIKEDIAIENAVGVFEAGAAAIRLDITKAVSIPQAVPPK